MPVGSNSCLGCGLGVDSAGLPIAHFCFTDSTTGCPPNATPLAGTGTPLRRDPTTGCLWLPPNTQSFATANVSGGGQVSSTPGVGLATTGVPITNSGSGVLRGTLTISNYLRWSGVSGGGRNVAITLSYSTNGGATFGNVHNQTVVADTDGIAYHSWTHVIQLAIAAGTTLNSKWHLRCNTGTSVSGTAAGWLTQGWYNLYRTST